jgi:hypothetical protein
MPSYGLAYQMGDAEQYLQQPQQVVGFGVSSQPEQQRPSGMGKRPKLSLASLIGQAILAHPENKARLSSIYEWIANEYPEYYKLNQGGWQVSLCNHETI